MPLSIIRQDITKISCDAIVNATNSALSPGGGLDAAVHAAGGPGLDAACRNIGRCAAGEAVLTKGYGLPCKYVIHTVGPVWQGGDRGEPELLRSCYRNSLALAKKKRCRSVALPLVSAGAFGFPKDRALKLAVEVIGEFLEDNEAQIYLVVFGREDFLAGSAMFDHIRSYIDDRCSEARSRGENRDRSAYLLSRPEGKAWSMEDAAVLPPPPAPMMGAAPQARKKAPERPFSAGEAKAAAPAMSLEEALGRLDESFSQALLRLIDEKGMTDAQCYKKANIDRKLFSKIRGDVHYRPSKTTAIAFAVALELNLGETREFLRKAGFALSRSSKFDIIIEYFIQNGNYNIYEINETLFAFDQSLLGN